MEYILTGTEMAECDTRTSEVIGIPSLVLMERAALSVADGADDYLKKNRGGKGIILAAAGRGNNGADALAAGRILLDRGYDVRFCRLSGEISPDSSFAVQERILASYGAEVPTVTDSILQGLRLPPPADRLHLCPDLSDTSLTAFSTGAAEVPDVILDGLFGTGLSRDLSGEAADTVHTVNRFREHLGSYVIAVDIPSGISSDTGKVMGCAVRCDETRTFAFRKRGHLLAPGTAFAGVCRLAQIGITPLAFKSLPGMFTMSSETARDFLPPRDPFGNKGTFGKVLIIAGREKMCGAAFMAARACMAAGAGMVKVFTHEANRVIIQQSLPEALLETYTEAGDPSQIREKLLSSLAWADIAAAGPGMGTDETAVRLLKEMLRYCAGPDSSLRGLVLDADAVRILAAEQETVSLLRERPAGLPCILTPHMGEFAALAGLSVRECIDGRGGLVQEQADRLHCTIACKDARTLVAHPSCPSGRMLYLNHSGCSGMASAGSGDVLTGMTAAFLALFTAFPQKETAVFTADRRRSGFDAACCAVYLHGIAGERAAAEHGEQGMTACDLIEELRKAAFWSTGSADMP